MLAEGFVLQNAIRVSSAAVQAGSSINVDFDRCCLLTEQNFTSLLGSVPRDGLHSFGLNPKAAREFKAFASVQKRVHIQCQCKAIGIKGLLWC